MFSDPDWAITFVKIKLILLPISIRVRGCMLATSISINFNEELEKWNKKSEWKSTLSVMKSWTEFIIIIILVVVHNLGLLGK